jgi:hypothetical protein
MMTATCVAVCSDFLANHGSGVIMTAAMRARSMTAKDGLGMLLMAAATKVRPPCRTQSICCIGVRRQYWHCHCAGPSMPH